MQKAILTILTVMAVTLFNTGCSDLRNETQTGAVTAENSGYSASSREPAYLADAYELISVLEGTHPAFVLGDIPDGYEQEKQEFIDLVTKDTTKEEFALLIRKYLAVLKDAHTGVYTGSSTLFLDMDCWAAGNEMFLLNKDGSLSEDRVTHIGGVPVSRIFEIVEDYFVAENDAARELNNSTWALNHDVLELAGCEITNDSAAVTIERESMANTKNVKFVSKDIYRSYPYKVSSQRIGGDIFYIDLNACQDDKDLKEHAKRLKDAVKNGITKVIIDVRDNSGGNSMACVRLLNAMGMEPPGYGCFIRYSELARKIHRCPSEGHKQYDPDRARARKNEKIELVVLANERTFSSATMMAVFVQDGGLGTVIGRPSSNSPSNYGDVLPYKLPVSSIEVAISYKRWLRPDTEADQKVLWPDIVTDRGEDALKRAIEYLS